VALFDRQSSTNRSPESTGPVAPCGQLRLGPLSGLRAQHLQRDNGADSTVFSVAQPVRNNRSGEALQIAASGKVKVMTETYLLDEITKAYERVADGKCAFVVYTKRTFQAAESSYRMCTRRGRDAAATQPSRVARISKISSDLSGRIGEILEL